MTNNRLEPKRQNEIIQKSVKSSIQELFPIESGGKTLRIKNVTFEDNLSDTNFPEQKEVKLNRKTWENTIKGDIEIIDSASGRILDRKTNITIGKIPKLTNRFSAIIKGNEYQVTNQLRRKAGIYSRQKRNGELEAEFNLAKGANFTIELNPNNKKFYLILRGSTRKFHLWNLLDLLGVSESDIKKSWGQNLLELNRKSALNNEQAELTALHKRLLRPRGPARSFETILKELQQYFTETEMDPEVNKITLGQGFEKVSGASLLEASKKLLDINRGEKKPDNRDNLIFKNLYSVEDQLSAYFEGNKQGLQRKIENSLSNRDKVREVLPANIFSKSLEKFFTTTDLSSTPPQTNPVAITSNARKTTVMGEGGIQNEFAITQETRDFNPSDIGFLDALATPEGTKVGVNVNLTSNVRKRNKDIETPVISKTGKKEYKTPMEFYKSTVGLPDQFEMKNGKPKAKFKQVKALQNEQIVEVKPSEIDFWVSSTKDLFDYHTNTIPFLHNTQGNRGATAGRMLTQALPLDEPEAPLVQVKKDNKQTFEKFLGNYFNPTLIDETGDPKSKGEVIDIGDEYITVETDKGDEVKVGLYKEFPLNEDGYLNSEPIVQVGDKVTAKQPLAKNNYTEEDGTLSVGKNLMAGYLPYKGYSFEDGAVITEGAAKKLSHSTIHKENIYFKPQLSEFSLKKFRAYFPDVIAPSNAKKLNSEGLPKKGQTFEPGEILAAFLVEKQMDEFDKALKRLDRSIYTPYRKHVLEWDSEEPGTVQEVRRSGRNIDIYVKATHPFKVGDKIANRFGGKNIITNIIPDSEAPHLEDGTPIEIMLNPNGVPGRMNTGQIHETAAAKIAKKKGKPYIVDNFADPEGDEAKKILQELAAEGIKANETVYDGKTGKPIENEIFVGPQYFMKLRHLVKKKQKAHDFGVYDIDEQPVNKSGAQKMGTLESYAYLGHGSKNLLREATTIKGQKNEEYFRDLQFGIPPGKPNRPYVFDKMIDYMRAAGVDVEKKGNKMRILPLTDARTLELSNGELTDPGAMLVGKNLTSRKGGLFDKDIAGGVLGEKYSHISLPSEIPNPMMEVAIKALLDLTNKQYNQIISGNLELEGKTGPEAILSALSNIDVDQALEQAKLDLEDAPETNVNKLNRKVRVLSALQDLDISPREAYKMKHVLVIPPKARPAYPLPSGDLRVSDINRHYRDVGLISKSLKEAKDLDILDEEDEAQYQKDLYNTVKAMQGFIDPITYGQRKYKGALKELSPTKSGLIFGKTWSKRQDLTGRSTITAEPSLGLDEVGIPEGIAKKVFKPFVVRELKESGMKGSKAIKEVENFTPQAQQALQRIMDKKHVLLNRAPSLHKHSVQAFNPKLVTGKDIKLNPLVVGGYNADFNGDSCNPLAHIDLQVSDKDFFSGTFDEFVKNYLLKGATDKDLLNLAKNGTLILQVKNLKTLGLNMSNEIDYVDVSEFTVHTSHGPCYKLEIKGEIPLVTTEHHNISYLDLETLKHRMIKTEDMNPGAVIPIVGKVKTKSSLESIKLEDPERIDPRVKIDNEIDLDFNFGYWLGYYVGDGSLIGGNTISQACVPNKTKKILQDTFEKAFGKKCGTPADFRLYDEGGRLNFYGATLYRWLGKHCNRTAKNKKFPGIYLKGNVEFRKGLVSGIIDADGCVTNGSSKYAIVNFTSISKTLISQLKKLLASLGINSEITLANRKTTKDNQVYNLTIAVSDLDKVPFHPDSIKYAKFKKLRKENPRSIIRDNMDLVPYNNKVHEEIKQIGFKSRGLTKEQRKQADKIKQNYKRVGLKDVKGKALISRKTAKRLLYKNVHIFIEEGSELLKRWANIVENKYIKYNVLENIEQTKRWDITYDFTIPESETFVVDGGVITHNTMSVSVPVTRDGEEEAKAMKPSNILFKHGDGMLVPSISHEYAYGLAKLSEKRNRTGKSFSSIDEAKEADLHFTDVFNLNGKEMTIGQWLINKPIPDEYKDYDKIYNKKEVETLLTKIGKEKPQYFAEVINNFKDLGAMYSYKKGMTMSITDLSFDRSFRDQLIQERLPQIKKLKDKTERITGYEKLVSDLEKEQNKRLKGKNNIMDLLETGALSGGKAKNVRQVLTAPGVLLDVRENPIDRPLLKSYAEGLDTGDYLTSMPGVRKGVVNKAISTQDSGALNKALLAVNRRLLIVEEDCGTEEGIEIEVNDRNILGRTALFSVDNILKRNDLIEGDDVLQLKENNIDKIKVRSPLTCESVEGICQMCYGAKPGGKLPSIGENVGILDSQAVSERSTQLSLSAFHCLHGDNIIYIKENGEEKITSFKKLWNKYSAKQAVISKDGQQEIYLTYPIKIWDDNKWSKVKTLIRHKQHSDTNMVMMRTRDNSFIISQDNHPHMLALNKDVCKKCGTPYKKPKKLGIYQCPDCKQTKSTITHESDNNYQLVEPKEFTKSKYFAKTGFPVWQEDTKTPFLDPYLIGLHISEGCTSGHNGKIYKWQITQNEDSGKSIIDKFKPLMAKHGKVCHYTHKDWSINDVELARKIRKKYGGYSWEKHLPEDFIYFSDEALASILCGLIDGDGSVIENDKWQSGTYMSLETTSYELMQQLSLILDKFKMKHSVTLAKIKDLTRHQSYQVFIYPDKSHKHLFKNSVKAKDVKFTKRNARKDRDNLVTYCKDILFDPNEEYVYDIETESHTLSVNGFWTHNSGGSTMGGSGNLGSFPRLEQLVKVPANLSGKATLAPTSLTIEKIEKNDIGGYDVKAKGRKTPLTIAPGRKPVVREGQRIRKGDRISDGIIQPQELGELKNHLEAQKYIVDEMDSVFGGDFEKKTFETVIAGLSDNAEVTKAPEGSGFYRGDTTSRSRLDKINKERRAQGLDPIEYKSYFKSIDTLNTDNPDWLTRITTNRVKQGLQTGAATAMYGNLAGKDPIPSYIYGEDFGRPERKGAPTEGDERGFY